MSCWAGQSLPPLNWDWMRDHLELAAGCQGNGNPLQYSCLENPVDWGAWKAAVPGVAQSQTRLKRCSMHACIGEGHGSPLWCSCSENPRDRGAWWAAIYGITQSRTRLKRLSSSSSSSIPGRGRPHQWSTRTSSLRLRRYWVTCIRGFLRFCY